VGKDHVRGTLSRKGEEQKQSVSKSKSLSKEEGLVPSAKNVKKPWRRGALFNDEKGGYDG